MIPGVRMKFDHVSIAVRSIDRAYDFFRRYFPAQFRNEKRRDDQVSGSFHWQDFWLGGFAIEMIEDLPGGTSFVTKFLQKHGEGLHHLSIEVDHLKPLVEGMRAGGVRIVDEQEFPDGSATAFVSPRSAFGTLIQFWQVADFDAHLEQKVPGNGGAKFDHVAIAVTDIRRAFDFFSRFFPAKITLEPHRSSRGNFLLGYLDIAGFKLELIQSPGPGTPNDFVTGFIEKYGEGMHHISVHLKEFDALAARLKADGIRVVGERTNSVGQREFFISPTATFGALIQVRDGV